MSNPRRASRNMNVEQVNTVINAIIDSLGWINPAINPTCGQIVPSAGYLVDGMLAYADGTNWNPGGGKGFYRYTGSAWIHIAAECFTDIDTTGDVVINNSAKGVVLKDTQGTPHYWRVTVNNVGGLVTTDLGTVKP